MNARLKTGLLGGLAALALPGAGLAGVIYTDWTAATTGNPGSATGTMGSIGVSYSGNLAFAQTTGAGVNYWARSSPPPYSNPGYNAFAGVPNMPTDSDIVAQSGATTYLNTITFSQPVSNPIMLIMSLGQPGLHVRYDFGQDFDILSSGNGHWGGSSSGSLFEEAGDVLKGVEGHGAIQFKGTFTQISWTTDRAENWHGFTVGVIPEPSTTAVLAGLGLASFAAVRRLGRQK